MSYNSNIPLGTDAMTISQGQIYSNYNAMLMHFDTLQLTRCSLRVWYDLILYDRPPIECFFIRATVCVENHKK